MRSDNKIKKGQSTWFDNFCSYWITNHNNAPIAITCDQDYEGAQETADKFVASYNACYGAGINPEAVPSMQSALKHVYALPAGTLPIEIIMEIQQALEKAGEISY